MFLSARPWLALVILATLTASLRAQLAVEEPPALYVPRRPPSRARATPTASAASPG